MIKNVSEEQLRKLKNAISLWYKLVPAFREKYKGKDPSSYNKREVDKIISLKNKIDAMEKELELKPSDKFRILMELL